MLDYQVFLEELKFQSLIGRLKTDKLTAAYVSMGIVSIPHR